MFFSAIFCLTSKLWLLKCVVSQVCQWICWISGCIICCLCRESQTAGQNLATLMVFLTILSMLIWWAAPSASYSMLANSNQFTTARALCPVRIAVCLWPLASSTPRQTSTYILLVENSTESCCWFQSVTCCHIGLVGWLCAHACTHLPWHASGLIAWILLQSSQVVPVLCQLYSPSGGALWANWVPDPTMFSVQCPILGREWALYLWKNKHSIQIQWFSV